jgi:hypothetical protein
METTCRRIWTKVCSDCRENNIVTDALSKLEKDENEKLSETEEGLVLSHAMCTVEQNKAIVMPETKEELARNTMNVDEMEAEEFPMSPEIIAREQKKDMLIPQVRPAHKYPNSPWEMSHPPGGDNAVCM